MESVLGLQGIIFETLPQSIVTMLIFYFAVKSIDFATGILKTWKGISPYESSKMREGLIRWIAELLALLFVVMFDYVLSLSFYLTQFTIVLFIYKEVGSVIENLGTLGVEFPEQLQKFVNILQKKTQNETFKNKESDKDDK